MASTCWCPVATVTLGVTESVSQVETNLPDETSLGPRLASEFSSLAAYRLTPQSHSDRVRPRLGEWVKTASGSPRRSGAHRRGQVTSCP